MRLPRSITVICLSILNGSFVLFSSEAVLLIELTNPPGHLWRDKWTALSGPLSVMVILPEKEGTAFERGRRVIFNINRKRLKQKRRQPKQNHPLQSSAAAVEVD